MFAISKRGQYGLAAVLELALRYNSGPIQIKEIADTCSIPQQYLEQLLLVLKKAGFVKSFRGAQGGYTLGSIPVDISVFEVMQCLEGRLSLVNNDPQNDSLDFFWSPLKHTIKENLDISLAQLIIQKQKYESLVTYNI